MGYKATLTYNSGLARDYGVTYWNSARAQTFVCAETAAIGRVQFEANKSNIQGAGYLICGIRNTWTGSPSTPSGTFISYGVIDSNTFQTYNQGPLWYTVDMTPVNLDSGTRYSFEVVVQYGDSAHCITLWGNHASNTNKFNGTPFYRNSIGSVDGPWYVESSAYAGSFFGYHFKLWGSEAVPNATGYVSYIDETGAINKLRLISVADAEADPNIKACLRIIDKDGVIRCADLVSDGFTRGSNIHIDTNDGKWNWRLSGA